MRMGKRTWVALVLLTVAALGGSAYADVTPIEPDDYNECNPEPGAAALQGDNENDVMIGTPLADLLRGGGGDDKINGRQSGDCLQGQQGSDRLSGKPGGDLINGGAGNDKAKGGSGEDRIKGAAGRDFLNGGTGRDSILGGPGNDHISANDSFKDKVNCGSGVNSAVVDPFDRVRHCQKVKVR